MNTAPTTTVAGPTVSAPLPAPVAAAWASSADAAQIAQFLRDAGRSGAVLITTHAKPDGDAIGSTTALARALIHAGARAEIAVAGPLPRWVPEMTRGLTLHELLPGKPATLVGGPPFRPSAAAYAVVDTGSWSQLAEMRPVLEGQAARTVLVDHHLHGDADVGDLRLIDPRCASATQALAPVCCRLCGVDEPCAAKLPLPIARALYLGLATDTGWLRYSSVTPATLRLAADLLETGVDHTELYRMIEQQDEPARWRLLGRALGTLSLHTARGRDDVAVMTLSSADFAATGATRNDTNGFADMVLTVASVEVSVVLTEQDVPAGEPPLTKLSFRSKPGPHAVDVNAAAQTLGGGGHARAAGGKVKAPLAEAKRQVLAALGAK